jgi:hypothetical protein
VRSVYIGRLYVDTGVVGSLSLVKRFSRNHALIEVNMQKLPHDFVALSCVVYVDNSAAITPKWLISRELVVDGLVNFIFILFTHLTSGILYTNGFRHVFLEDKLDLVATVAFIDQAKVKTVSIFLAPSFTQM